MDPTTSLFARARPRVSLPKKKEKMSFLELPGEIRNRVYQYYFRESYNCELVGAACHRSPATPTITFLPDSSTSKRDRYGGRKDLESERSLVIRFPRLRRPNSTVRNLPPLGWLNPHGALVLVCKQIHAETLPLLYQRITFVVQAPRRITAFLHKIPKPSYSYVTKLHLHYSTYGSPKAASDVVWQEKHIESWNRVCKVASKSLTCLQELRVDVWINQDAPKFNLRQKWLQPLWQFRRLACKVPQEDLAGAGLLLEKLYRLGSVHVRVKSRLWAHNFEGNARLANACKHLHRLYGHGISKAILGAKEEEAMSAFDKAWNKRYHLWQHHLGFARTGW
ncbi:hypothetical protein SVAN01_10027 [Stagonosporopsis vannaccii]|nr:hypothetical protein SVAN01_10027 [Stagonosporopsis vannaccii]